jgi:murein DD-endopeptidase MepM/ murein hydrolase activator NlpD
MCFVSINGVCFVKNMLGGAKSMGNKNSKIIKFMSGKGFYAVLAVCLIGAGAASWVAIDRTMSSLDNNHGTQSDYYANLTSNSFFQNGDTDVDNTVSNIKKPTSSTTQLSSSDISSEASNSSKVQSAATDLAKQPQQFILPVSGEVLNQFSNHELVKSTTMGDWRTHDGVDISCPIGTEVLCVADGVVTETREDALWGVVVTIKHNDVESVYCGLEKEIKVNVGDKVKLGDVIGTVGKNAIIETALKPHLHFEIKDASGYVDPVKFINN